MPRSIVVGKHTIAEGLDVFLSNRLVTADGTNLQIADASGDLSIRVYDLSAAADGRVRDRAIFEKTNVDIDSSGPLDTGKKVISNTLETGSYWDGRDSTGMNFCYQLRWDSSGAVGPHLRGGHKYRVDFELTTTDFGVLRWTHFLDVQDSPSV